MQEAHTHTHTGKVPPFPQSNKWQADQGVPTTISELSKLQYKDADDVKKMMAPKAKPEVVQAVSVVAPALLLLSSSSSSSSSNKQEFTSN